MKLATTTGLAANSQPKNMTADVQYAIDKCESVGSGKQLILHGNPSALAKNISPHMAVPRRHFFLPIMHLQCCISLQGTLGGNFDIFAASGESTAWVFLLTTRSRPYWREGLSCSPIQLFQHCIPREWTLVVFWKENAGTSAPANYTRKRRKR